MSELAADNTADNTADNAAGNATDKDTQEQSQGAPFQENFRDDKGSERTTLSTNLPNAAFSCPISDGALLSHEEKLIEAQLLASISSLRAAVEIARSYYGEDEVHFGDALGCLTSGREKFLSAISTRNIRDHIRRMNESN